MGTKIDARFVSLLKWLGENHINVRLSGENTEEGYAVYKIREIAFGGGTKLSAEDGFLQFMIERLLASNAPAEEENDEDEDEAGDDMKLTSLQSITDFRIISAFGQDVILPWHVLMKYHRKKDVMHRERFLL